MNGPEHYIDAERLLKLAGNSHHAVRPDMLAAAQVHATLAVAAATAEAAPESPTCGPLVQPPTPAGVPIPDAPAYPGNDWGRAIYGEVAK